MLCVVLAAGRIFDDVNDKCAAATLRIDKPRHLECWARGVMTFRQGWSGRSTQVNRGATLMLKWVKRLRDRIAGV